MPVKTINLTTTNGRVGSYLVLGMISTDFILSYYFWFFRLFFILFYVIILFSWVLY